MKEKPAPSSTSSRRNLVRSRAGLPAAQGVSPESGEGPPAGGPRLRPGPVRRPGVGAHLLFPLSVVPVVAAVVFGIAKASASTRSSGGAPRGVLRSLDILMKVFRFSDSMLEKTSGGIVAGIGVALLFWSSSRSSLHRGRVQRHLEGGEAPFHRRKCSDYLSSRWYARSSSSCRSSLTVTLAGR
jgi:hypothetical protein